LEVLELIRPPGRFFACPPILYISRSDNLHMVQSLFCRVPSPIFKITEETLVPPNYSMEGQGDPTCLQGIGLPNRGDFPRLEHSFLTFQLRFESTVSTEM